LTMVMEIVVGEEGLVVVAADRRYYIGPL